ncbi:hypothetical protein Zmor_016976 [Zophobas morio]|uniref:Uncharacterized protein n=1 Tax=Zophobas morio TaxID=2755281 RepID=A0AA38MC92_9CUCU|nr:hypothetical protein Zmor_016976 [Zophobas morio]
MTVLTCILAATVIITCSATIPPNFKRCQRTNPQFQTCLLEAAQHGVQQLTKPYQELDLPNLEPLEVAALTVSGGSTVSAGQNFSSCSVHGLTGIKLDKFRLDLKTKILEASGTIKRMKFSCRYELDGRTFGVPVQSQGNSTIAFDAFKANFFALFDEVLRAGKTYYQTAYSEMTSSVDKVDFQFDHNFEGGKVLENVVKRILNENWREISGEIQADYNGVIRQTLTKIIDRILNKVSIEELFG